MIVMLGEAGKFCLKVDEIGPHNGIARKDRNDRHRWGWTWGSKDTETRGQR
jgi:hypothetical protein